MPDQEEDWLYAWDIVPSIASYPGPEPFTFRFTPRFRLPGIGLGLRNFGLSPALGIGIHASRELWGPRGEVRLFVGNQYHYYFRAIGGFLGAACEASWGPECEQFEFSAGLEIPIPIT